MSNDECAYGPRLRRVVACNLRREMACRHLGVTEFAELLGVSKSHMYRVLDAKLSVTIDWLARVAEALGTSVTVLLAEAPNRAAHRSLGDALEPSPQALSGPMQAQTFPQMWERVAETLGHHLEAT